MRLTVILVFIGALCGCATNRYHLEIDSVSEESTEGRTFSIKSGLNNLKESDLRFQRFSKIVSNTLLKKGYKPAEVEKAEMIILLSYGVGDPQTSIHSYSVPVYDNSSTTTQVRNRWGQNIGSYKTTSSNPYAPSSYQTVNEEETSFTRTIILRAYEAKDFLKPRAKDEVVDAKMLWETKITSTGSSDDLRKIFPIMLIGASQFIGEDSGNQREVTIRIKDDDPRIKEISGGTTISKEVRRPAAH